jgi:hypothetical protein
MTDFSRNEAGSDSKRPDPVATVLSMNNSFSLAEAILIFTEGRCQAENRVGDAL